MKYRITVIENGKSKTIATNLTKVAMQKKKKKLAKRGIGSFAWGE